MINKIGNGLLAAIAGAVLVVFAAQAAASDSQPRHLDSTAKSAVSQPLSDATPTKVNVALHNSFLIHLPEAAVRVAVGNPEVADVTLLSPREVYVLGKTIGTTNILVWSKGGVGGVIDVTVAVDVGAIRSTLGLMLPGETGMVVTPSADSVILSGDVTDAFKIERAVAVAESFAGSKKVVNMLRATAPQQVMLEVKIAEVSKTAIDRLGADFTAGHAASIGGFGWSIGGGLLSGSASFMNALKNGSTSGGLTVDALRQDEIVKVLAEPNIMAISGQEGSFLAGGKIFIPVPQGSLGSVTITLEEKEFGIGLRFTPTVLEDGRINLRVTPEVSEINTAGVVIDALGIGKTVLPSITTRRASTTVQLRDGQTFAIGGLIKSNVTETIKRFPGLGEIPVLGALFRSTDFKRDKTELMFIVTPHLVKPLDAYTLPTDHFVEPTRMESLLNGKVEGSAAPTNSGH